MVHLIYIVMTICAAVVLALLMLSLSGYCNTNACFGAAP